MAPPERPMRIGVIGGGRRCRTFLEMLDTQRFPRLQAEIVAVADPDENAAGVQLARKKGIFTTGDYRDFHQLENLDLVIELTGKDELWQDFEQNSPAKVRVLEATVSRLFSDLIRFQEDYLRSQHQLELIESIVNSVFSGIRDHVLILRPDRRIVDANEALLNSLGMSSEEVVGKYCHQITHRSLSPCNGKGCLCPLKETLETGATSHAIHEHFDRDDQIIYYEITTVPLKNDKGEVELVLEIMWDITDQLEQKVEQKTRVLKRNLARLVHEDKMIALGKLVASAVHEINNPLSGIHALARLMRRQLEDGLGEKDELEQFKYYLNLIDTESARCSTIVGNLLSFSRQQKLERRWFEINEVIQKVVLLCRHKLQLQRIRLNFSLDEHCPHIMGDPGQIQQCLINLIFNAMEAMPKGGELSVRTISEAARNEVRLEVEDTGVGIPQEKMSQIFEPFFSTKSQDKGVGLGLSVVYGIIKEHQGTVYVKSEVGKGSNFILRFPAEPASDEAEEPANT